MKLSDEEQKAIEKVKEVIKIDKERRIVTKYDEKPLFRDQLQIIIDLLEKNKKQIKDLKDENDFLRFMYKGTEEYKAIEKYASGDHIPRID